MKIKISLTDADKDCRDEGGPGSEASFEDGNLCKLKDGTLDPTCSQPGAGCCQGPGAGGPATYATCGDWQVKGCKQKCDLNVLTNECLDDGGPGSEAYFDGTNLCKLKDDTLDPTCSQPIGLMGSSQPLGCCHYY